MYLKLDVNAEKTKLIVVYFEYIQTIKDDLKNEDDLQNKADPHNENDFKITDDCKNEEELTNEDYCPKESIGKKHPNASKALPFLGVGGSFALRFPPLQESTL